MLQETLKMSTIRQKRLAKAIVDNSLTKKPLGAGQMLENVGYKASVAKHKPKEIIEAEGVKVSLHQLGFDEESAKRVVAEILRFGEDDNVRIAAAKEIFKVHGSYAAEKVFNLTANATVDELKEIIQKDLAKFRPDK